MSVKEKAAGITGSCRAGLARLILKTGGSAFWILNFHRVIGDDEVPTGTTPFIRKSTFARLLHEIVEFYGVVSLSDLLSLRRSGKRPHNPVCAITFDDGWKSVYDNGLPVLRSLGLPATIFLPVGFIGTTNLFWQDLLYFALKKLYVCDAALDEYLLSATGFSTCRYLAGCRKPRTLKALHACVVAAIKAFAPERQLRSVAAIRRAARSDDFAPPIDRVFLNWDEVREMARHDVDFGSHGVWHEMLTRLPDDEVRRELVESKARLEAVLGKRTRFFAYPNDDLNSWVAMTVSQTGYEAAFVQRDRRVRKGDSDYSLPRCEVREDLVTTRSGGFCRGALQCRFSEPVVRAGHLTRTIRQPARRRLSMRPIRVAAMIDFMPGPVAGTEKQLLELLARLDRKRIQPYLVVLKPAGSSKLAAYGLAPAMISAWLNCRFDICPIHQLNSNFSFDFASVRGFVRLLSFLTSRRIEVVHTFFQDSALMGLLANKIARKKIIVSRRSCGHDDTSGRLFVLSLLCGRNSRVLANSQAAAEVWKKSARFSRAPVDVLRNGIEIEDFQTFCQRGRDMNRQELGLPLKPFIVGVVANLRPVKGLDVLLDAAKIVVGQCPNTFFVLVGSGQLETKLKSQSKRLGIEKKVFFAGSQQQVGKYLACFDIGVLSSLSEGLSNAIIEYMAAGLPVVATNVGGNVELVDHGVTGFLVPQKDPVALAESLLRLLNDAGLREEMGKAGLVKASSEFSMAKMVREYESYYERLAFGNEDGMKTDSASRRSACQG